MNHGEVCVLPEGWAAATVGSIFRLSGGGTPSRGNSSYWGGSIPWLSSGDIKSPRIETSSEFITEAGLAGSSANLCRAGAVVVVVRSGILKHTLPIAVLDRPAAINQDLRCLDSGSDDLNEWLALALRASSRFLLEKNREGTTVQSVKTETLRDFILATPPLTEQRRIVAKVEALLGRVNAARERLARVPTLLRRFRQSILAAACGGRLTADWRDDGQTNDLDSVIAAIVRTRSTKAAKEFASTPDDDLPPLPPTWRWVRFGLLIGQLQNGVSRRPAIEPPGLPILRISAVRPGIVFLDDHRFMPDAEEFFPAFAVRDGDLFFTRYNGSLDLLGICGLARGTEERKILYPDKLMRVRFDHPYVDPAYAELYFRHPGARNRITSRAKSSAGQQGISGADVKAQPFALPPIAEQHEIVRRVDALFKLADAIERRVADATRRVERVTQAILAKAFRGELVPTEAELARIEGREYETAEMLLARIGEELALASSKDLRLPRSRTPR